MKISGIYKITSPNNRIYVGLSTSIYDRWNHYNYLCNSKSQKLLNRSFSKYGVNNHQFEIIEECNTELLEEREIYWIDKLKTYHCENKKGLNLTKGGNFPPKQNKPKSEEHKLKIGLGRKGKKHSEETKEKLRQKRALQVFTPEQNKKRADSRRGQPSKLKGRKRPNISEKLKGRITPISIKCKLINTLTNEIIEANSIQELSRITKISVSSILKIREGLIVKKYIEYIYEQ